MLRILPLAAAALAAGALHAQSLYTIDQNGQLTQQNGPGGGPCNYPLGPLLAQYSYVTGSFCVSPAETGPGPEGGMTMDRLSDTLWITDGFIVSEYQNFGTPLQGFDVPLGTLFANPVTGIAYDPSLGALWLTDGLTAAAVTPPNPCPGTHTVVSGPFPLPLVAQAATALDYDPSTDTLWFTDSAGNLVQSTKTGALGSFGSVNVSAGSPCGLTNDLRGLAIDTAQAPGTMYVTDGTTMAYVDAGSGGASAPTTFYTPNACYFPIASPLNAIVYAATPSSFGSPSGAGGFSFFPAIGSTGQSVIPNTAFEIGVAGGLIENEIAVLVMSTGHLCPSTTVAGVPFHLTPSPLIQIAVTIVDATLNVSVPTPLGLGTPIGVTLFFQWGILDPATFQFFSTRGLALTTSRP